MSSNDIKKCPFCKKIFFNSGEDKCPFCGKNINNTDFFNEIFNPDNDYFNFN